MSPAALPPSGTAAAAPTNWEGSYMGAQASHAEGKSQDRSNANAAENSPRGFTGGVQAGRTWQFDSNGVVGIKAGLAFGDIDRDRKDREHNPHSPCCGRDAVTRSGSVNLMLGYGAGPVLPYLTTGVTVARQEYTLGGDTSLVEATNGCRVAETATPTWAAARCSCTIRTTPTRPAAASIPTTAALR